jgi:hypothetical protein
METMSNKTELAILRDQHLAKLRAQTGLPERITLDFACAVHDRDFRVTFARFSRTDVFRCESIDKNGARQATAPARVQAIFTRSEPVHLAVDEVDFESFYCAGCAAKTGWTRCDRCMAFVCGAHSAGGRFTCRESCGARFTTVPLKTLSARGGSNAGGQKAIGQTARGLLTARRDR